MITSLMVLQAIVSVLLILLVLLQFGKGAEAGLLSGGASDSMMTGAQRGNILSKMTVVLAVLFLGNSILLARLQSSTSTKSILDSEAPIAVPLNSDVPAASATAAPTPVVEASATPAAETTTEETN